MIRWAHLLGPFLLAALTSASLARADRIHLEGGGVIEADSWSEDGETLRIDGPSGSIRLPRSMVVRIERASPQSSPRGESPKPAAPDTRRPSPAPAVGLPLIAGGSREDPRLATLLASARDALLAKDYGRAAAGFHEALTLSPDLIGARIGYAIAEMALGREPVALPVVMDGLVRHPKSADLHELLGDLRDREERVDDALVAWRTAFELDPNDRLLDKIQRAERELHAGRDYAFSAAAHFTLRFDEALDRELTGEILDVLEERYLDLSDAFRHAPQQPITVLLYPTRQFREVAQVGEDIGGIYDGKIRLPLGGIRRLDDRARSTIVHELTHAFVQSKTRGNCPQWLHEGLAQRFEGRPSSPADARSVRAILASGDPASWEERGFSYAAALSLTRWLESLRGWEGILDLLDRLGRGSGPPAALQDVYGLGYRDLCLLWAESLEESPRR